MELGEGADHGSAAKGDIADRQTQNNDPHRAEKLEPLSVSIDWDGNFNRGLDAALSVRDAAKILLMLARGGDWKTD